MGTLNAADAILLGSTPVDAVYLGATKVWPSESPTSSPPIENGRIVQSGDYRYHYFDGTGGTFNLNVHVQTEVDYLLAGAGGGGGSGGANTAGGGGGGGGIVAGQAILTPGVWPITVGAAGAGGAESVAAVSGGASHFMGVEAFGGGFGGGLEGPASGDGGSSGGASGEGPVGAALGEQGFSGGAGTGTFSITPCSAGGGGGGGGVGEPNFGATTAMGGTGYRWIDQILYSEGGTGSVSSYPVGVKNVPLSGGGGHGGGGAPTTTTVDPGTAGAAGVVAIRYAYTAEDVPEQSVWDFATSDCGWSTYDDADATKAPAPWAPNHLVVESRKPDGASLDFTSPKFFDSLSDGGDTAVHQQFRGTGTFVVESVTGSGEFQLGVGVYCRKWNNSVYKYYNFTGPTTISIRTDLVDQPAEPGSYGVFATLDVDATEAGGTFIGQLIDFQILDQDGNPVTGAGVFAQRDEEQE